MPANSSDRPCRASFGQRAIGEKGIDGPRAGIARRELVEAEQQRVARNQAVLAERLAIEEHRLGQPEPGIEPAMEHALALEPFRADAQRLQDASQARPRT